MSMLLSLVLKNKILSLLKEICPFSRTIMMNSRKISFSLPFIRDIIPESQKKYSIIGLYLLYLLAYNK